MEGGTDWKIIGMKLVCVKLDSWSQGHLNVNQTYDFREIIYPDGEICKRQVNILVDGSWWGFCRDNFISLEQSRETKIKIILDGESCL